METSWKLSKWLELAENMKAWARVVLLKLSGFRIL